MQLEATKGSQLIGWRRTNGLGYDPYPGSVKSRAYGESQRSTPHRRQQGGGRRMLGRSLLALPLPSRRQRMSRRGPK
jgi:hypothetical protein